MDNIELNTIHPMSMSVPLDVGMTKVAPGKTIRIVLKVSYKASLEFEQYFKLSLYSLTWHGKSPAEGCQVGKECVIPASATDSSVNLIFDMEIPPAADDGPDDGKYGLAVWLSNVSTSMMFGLLGLPKFTQDDVVEVSGNPKGLLGSIGDLIPSLLSVMVMSMMMNMMGGAMGGGAFDQGGYAPPYPSYPPSGYAPQITVSRPPYPIPYQAPYQLPPAPYQPPEIMIIPG